MTVYCCERFKAEIEKAKRDQPKIAAGADGQWFVQQWCCYDECGESPHEVIELNFCPFCGTALRRDTGTNEQRSGE